MYIHVYVCIYTHTCIYVCTYIPKARMRGVRRLLGGKIEMDKEEEVGRDLTWSAY